MNSHAQDAPPVPPQRDRFVRTVAALVGAVFVVVGLLGFVPGITTDVDELTMADHESGAALLGIFHVSALHNVLHLLAGAAGLALSRAAGTAAAYLVLGGLAYEALWVFGLAVDREGAANVLAVDAAGNWLHLGLGAGMLVLGAYGYRRWRGTWTADAA